MKKFISLVLALVMALSLTTAAWGVGVSCSAAAPCGHAAATGGLHYDSLQDAVDDAAVGGTVELLKDLTLTCTGTYGSVDITTGMDVVIKGNGHTITCDDGFFVDGGKLTLMSDLTVIATTYNAVYIRGGEVVTSANLTANGDYSAIQGNGSYSGDVTVTGGTVSAPNVSAIYHPQNGKLTISGGTITGNTGVYVKSGELSITGGTIEGTGPQEDYAYKASGIVLTGDALVIENVGGSSGYEAVSSVSVTGGTFTSANAAAVASYAATTENPSAVAVDEFIEGGTFSDDVSAYVASDTELISDGAGGYIAAAAAPGNTAATKFYVSDASATGGWKLLNSFSATKPTDLFVEADYDEYVPEGNLDHYDIDGAYYAVAAMNVAEYKLVYGNKVIYLNPVDADEIFYEAQAKVFTGVTADKDACGKVLVSKADLKKTYYVVTLEDTDGNEQKYYLVKVNAGGQTTLLVDGKIVEADFVNTFIEHNWVGNDVDKNGNYVSVACSRCGKIATLYANKTAAGKDAEFITGFGWITASAASYISAGAIDTTVESAQTFDAGIALYVGMSVMAATGAVVLKKKD